MQLQFILYINFFFFILDLFICGIDIQLVNVVINFDFFKNFEIYLYCIGCLGCFGYFFINLFIYEDRFELYKVEQELGIEIKLFLVVVDKKFYVVEFQQ